MTSKRLEIQFSDLTPGAQVRVSAFYGGKPTGLVAVLEAKEETRYDPPGNVYCGDLSGLLKVTDNITVADNSVRCVIRGFYFSAKVFAEPSDHGLDGGRVSKLDVCSGNKWDRSKEVFSFDRSSHYEMPSAGTPAGKAIRAFLMALDH